MKTKLIGFFLTALFMMPVVVTAQTNNPCTAGADGDIGQCVSQVYLWALGLSGLLAVTVSVWGGYLVMTARGNGEQAAKGKSYIYSALTGLVLLIGAYLLLNTINTDLTNFNTSLDGLDSAPPAQDLGPEGGAADSEATAPGAVDLGPENPAPQQ